MKIQQAEPDDVALIASIVRLLAMENGEDTPLTGDYVRLYLSTPGYGAFLAGAEGTVVGLLSYSIKPNLYHASPCMTVEELYVRPASRLRGVGSALIQAATALAGRLGCAEISVSTGTDNLPAQELYRRHGLVDESLLLEKHLV